MDIKWNDKDERLRLKHVSKNTWNRKFAWWPKRINAKTVCWMGAYYYKNRSTTSMHKGFHIITESEHAELVLEELKCHAEPNFEEDIPF